MKHLIPLLTVLLSIAAFADTPPPGTVKAKMYTGDGNTALTATGSALNVNVTNSGGLSTVDQGTAGTDPWVVEVTNASLPVTGTFWQTTQPVSGTFWQATQPVSGNLTCNAGSGTLAVSGPLTDTQLRASAVPITGTITATNSANGLAGSPAPTSATQVGGRDGSGNLKALSVSSSGVLAVDASGATVPVSGTFWQATQPVSAASLPLPTGAATSANQSTEITSLDTIATNTTNAGTPVVTGTVTANQGTPGIGAWPVLAAQSSTWSVTATQATGTNLHTVVDSSGLPSGAATSALQTSGNSSLTSIATNTSNIPALGQALAAGSVPVVLTASQLSTLTPLSTVAATQSGTWNVGLSSGSNIIGKVSIDQTTPGTTNGVQVNAALPAGSNVIGHVIADSGSTTAVTQGTASNLNATVVTTGGTTIAKDSSLSTINTTLGSPFQAGGSIGNTTFAATQSGTWNVNATPVVPTAATVKQAAITIGTSAVRLTTDGSAPSSTRTLLVAQLLSTSTASCYFGSSGVTSTSTGRGVQMFAGQSFSFNNDAGDYYAICDTSSQTFFVTEQE